MTNTPLEPSPEVAVPSILVAVDLDAPAPEPGPILTIALAAGWAVDLVNAVPLGATAHEVAEAEAELGHRAAALADHGVPVGAHVMIGPPIDVILAAAEAFRATMVVVAHHRGDDHHDTGGGRPGMGSVTASLLNVTDRPVIVLPAGPGRSDPGFAGAVDRLITLIDRQGEEAEPLVELRAAAEQQLADLDAPAARPRPHQRLLDALHRFETEHPTLTAAINDVSYHLSGMGV